MKIKHTAKNEEEKIWESRKQIITSSAHYFEMLPSSIKDNKNKLLELISLNGFVYLYLSQEWQKDTEIIKMAFESNFLIFHFLDEELRDKVDVRDVSKSFLKLMKDNGLLKNKFFAGLLVDIEGYNLQYLPEFQSDHDIVKRAVERCGHAIEDAVEEFKDNFDIAMIVVEQMLAFEYLSERLRGNKHILIKAINAYDVNGYDELYKYPRIMSITSDEMRKNEDVVIAIAKRSVENPEFLHDFKYVDDELMKNPIFMAKCLKINSQIIQCLSGEVKEILSSTIKYLNQKSDQNLTQKK